MFKQGPDFLFEIAVIRDYRSRDNESRLYLFSHLYLLQLSVFIPKTDMCTCYSRICDGVEAKARKSQASFQII